MSEVVQADILVVGAGPAGVAAAISARVSGKHVVLLDENKPGGQIWRHDIAHSMPEQAKKWLLNPLLNEVTHLKAKVISRHSQKALCVLENEKVKIIKYNNCILTTGARELFLPFPGWTTPGVFGLGGLQALAKGGWPIEGKKIILAGSGPLMLAVAASLKKRGANILLCAEQTTAAKLRWMAWQCLTHPMKALQGVGLKWELRGIPQYTDCWPVEVKGNGKVSSVILKHKGLTIEKGCDILACGFGLIPSLELPRVMELAVEVGKGIKTYGLQQTSDENIFAAGEVCGIGGVECALIEGQMAGYAAAGNESKAKTFLPAKKHAREFADALDKTFVLREEVKNLAKGETIVCRCEDVKMKEINEHDHWRSAKLHTRLGMGPCQGRICGDQLQTILGWDKGCSRHPIQPMSIAAYTEMLKSYETLESSPREGN